MRAVRHSTLQKAVAFKRAGGVVLAVGALPEASDRVGRDDPEVAAMVKELFPGRAGRATWRPRFHSATTRGRATSCTAGSARAISTRSTTRRKATECFFRATGRVELWDPWTGATRPLAVRPRPRRAPSSNCR